MYQFKAGQKVKIDSGCLVFPDGIKCLVEMRKGRLCATLLGSEDVCPEPSHWLPLEKTLYTLEIGDWVHMGKSKQKVMSVLPSDPQNPVYALSADASGKEISGFILTAWQLGNEGYEVLFLDAPITLTLLEAEKELTQSHGQTVKIVGEK